MEWVKASTEWVKFLQHKSYYQWILVFGACSFVSGMSANHIPKIIEELDSIDVPPQIEEFLLVTPYILPMGIFGPIARNIERKIQKEVESQEQKRREEVLSGYIEDRIRKPLERITRQINDDDNISKYLKADLLYNIGEAKKELNEVMEWTKAADDLLDWLDVSSNRSRLLNAVLEQVQVDKAYGSLFEDDLCECISWIYDSVRSMHPRNLESPEQFVSAMLEGMPCGLSPYITALKAMKSYLQDEIDTNYSKGLSWVISDAVESLQSRLETIEPLSQPLAA